VPLGVRWRDDSAAYASNWRTVIAIDLTMGLAVLVVGIALSGSGWGWLLILVGAIQLFFAGGRATRWRRMRRQSGL
jgi:hypothetical protein